MSDPGSQATPPSVKEIFLEVCDLPEEQREAGLSTHCGQDAALRARVQELLDAHDRAGEFLAGPTLGRDSMPASADSSPAPAASRQIGPYKLLQVIGEGGFGTVYMAEQESPVRRRVALKIIKPGMDTQQVIARFDAERQALAIMDHPNIAKVFDAGATGTGRPYFVMELVTGVPITEYCDKHTLDLTQRLELFGQVCGAVQHAHQKGIIHRDLKPSNILVSEQDGRALARVIDFGIAKATQSRLTEKTLFTEFRQMVGTPEYMSPEQAGGNLDVDTRSDIYSLGVLLYELLTGTTPFDGRKLRSLAYAEIERLIREVDPPAPSRRLSTMRQTIASVAAQRQLEPRKLNSLVHGELDWIVMRCLEKDRSRRYESASALAGDVRHYLEGKPVAAGPASAAYRFRKFVNRHRGAAVATATVLFVLVAGIIGTTIGLIGQARQHRIAEQQRAEAEKQAKEATLQAAIAQAVNQFQSDMLSSADPDRLLGDKVTVVQAMTAAVKELDAGKLSDQPLVEASVRETIGNTLRGLGRYDDAESNLRKAIELRSKALSATDPQIPMDWCNLAWLLRDRGNYAEAEALVRRAKDFYQKSGDERNLAGTIGGLGVLLIEQGKLSEAESCARDSLAIRRRILPPTHQDIARNLNNLASLLYEQGKYSQAEQTFREALTMYRETLPAGHPQIADGLNNLAMVLVAENRLTDAEPLHREALAIRRKAYPTGHQAIAGSLINTAVLLRELGKFDEAESLAREGLEMFQHAVPAGHPKLAAAKNTLAQVLQREGKFADAEPLYRQAIADYVGQFGKDHVQVALSRIGLGVTLGKLNQLAAAETELLEADRVLESTQGVPPDARAKCYEALAIVCLQRDQSEPGQGYDKKAREWQQRRATTGPATRPKPPL